MLIRKKKNDDSSTIYIDAKKAFGGIIFFFIYIYKTSSIHTSVSEDERGKLSVALLNIIPSRRVAFIFLKKRINFI